MGTEGCRRKALSPIGAMYVDPQAFEPFYCHSRLFGRGEGCLQTAVSLTSARSILSLTV